jgi:hypothetical protein
MRVEGKDAEKAMTRKIEKGTNEGEHTVRFWLACFRVLR